jgi:phosphatidylglycerophosphatase A
MRRMFLSFFGAGYLRPAPGTWGSLAALPAAWVFHSLGGMWLLLIATIVVYTVGVAAVRVEIENSDDHDPSWIVIDEVVGQWITLLPISAMVGVFNGDVLLQWFAVGIAVAAFRLFDIWKPWIIGRADARGDAVGVMLDDVLAGIFAGVILTLGYSLMILWMLACCLVS